MPRVPGSRRSFRFPWRSRKQIGEEVDDELGFHLEMRVEELVDSGLTPEAAHQQAMAQFGDLDGTRRALRAQGEAEGGSGPALRARPQAGLRPAANRVPSRFSNPTSEPDVTVSHHPALCQTHLLTDPDSELEESGRTAKPPPY